MPDAYTELRAELASKLPTVGSRVTEALLRVPRHVFLPGVAPEEAYSDEAIVTKRDQEGNAVSSSSQPTLMALMLDQLDLAPGARVLEIGAGTGYNAALIRFLTGPEGTVVSLDIDQDLVDQARAGLAAAGYPDVEVRCTDGALGYPPLGPYDRLMATVGVSDLAPAWLYQVTGDALIMVPLDVFGAQLLVTFARAGQHWASRSVEPCGFIRMRGELADSTRSVSITGTVRLQLAADREVADGAAIAAWLAQPPATVPTEVSVNGGPASWGLRLWIAATEPGYCGVGEEVVPGVPRLLPRGLLEFRTWHGTFGLVARAGIAFITPAPDGLTAIGHGEDAAELAARLAGHVRAWHDAGRPDTAGLHVDAYPRSGPGRPPAAGALIVDRPHTRFAVYRT